MTFPEHFLWPGTWPSTWHMPSSVGECSGITLSRKPDQVWVSVMLRALLQVCTVRHCSVRLSHCRLPGELSWPLLVPTPELPVHPLLSEPTAPWFPYSSASSFDCDHVIPWRRGRLPTPVFLGFPYGSAVKKSMRVTWVWSLGWEDPWRKERLQTPVLWPGEFHGLYSP